MKHTTVCPAPEEYTFAGRYGDRMQGCRGCGRTEPVDARQEAAGAARDASRRSRAPVLADEPDAHGIRHLVDCPGGEVRREVVGDRPADRCTGCRRFAHLAVDAPRAVDPFPTFRHGTGCAGPGYSTFIGRLGDEMVCCAGCRVTTPAYAVAPPPPRRAAAATPESRWRCPTHYEPVTATGTGCGQCEAVAAQSRKRRDAHKRNAPERRMNAYVTTQGAEP